MNLRRPLFASFSFSFVLVACPQEEDTTCAADSECARDDELCVENECRLILPPLPVAIDDDEAPLAARGVIRSTAEDTALELVLEATGGDGTEIAWRSFNDTPDIGVFRVVPPGDLLTFAPLPEASGLASCTITPIQSGRFGQPAQVFVDVGAVDDGPVLSVHGPFNTTVDTALDLTVSATDREQQNVVFTATFDNAPDSEGQGFDDNVATIPYVPPPGFVGVDSGDVTATDEGGASTTVKVTIVVE